MTNLPPIKPKQPLAIIINSMVGGGAERVTSILLDQLKDQYEIHLLIGNNIIEYDLPQEQKIYLFNFLQHKKGYFFKFLKIPFHAYECLQYFKKHNIEISLSFLNRPNFINCILKLYNWKGKVMISERQAPSKEYRKSIFKNLIGGNLIRLLYRKADLIIPNANGITTDLKNNFGLNKANFRVINNPINIEKIRTDLRLIEKRAATTFTFINIARLEKQKDHNTLLRAFAKLSYLDCQLVLLGKGSLEQEIKTTITELGLSDKVKLIGFSDKPFEYLKNADCFILSSDYEGFPNVVLEALACSLPVIATDCRTGPREILAPESDFNKEIKSEIEIGRYGLLTPVANVDKMAEAMTLLYTDTQLRKQFREDAFSRAKDFDLSNIIEQFRQVVSINKDVSK